jgi:hypothetical protein
MSADLDMNSNDILNLPYPSTDTSPIRRQDLATLADDEDIEVVTVTDYMRDTIFNIASEAALKTELDLEIGVDLQAWDADLDILAAKDWSTSVQATGRFGLNDDGGLMIYEAIGAIDPVQGVAARLQGNFSYTGGSGVTSTNYVLTDVSAAVSNFVWGHLSVLNNSATGGENVAIYGQAFKNSTGDTWAAVFEVDDTTEVANPTGAIYGIEVDVVGNDTDSGNKRRGIEIIGWRSNIAGADVQHAYGFRIGPSDVDVDNVVFKKGISLTNGSGATLSAFQIGIDLSEATYSNAALKIGTDQGLIWDNNGSVSSAYNSVLASLESTINASSTNTVLFHTLSRRTSGTAAAGIGSGIQFLTESDTAVDRIGGYLAMAMSSVVNASEEATFEFGLLTGGVAAASKMQMTATSLRPMANDGMALGTTAKMWSDLFLASGGVINWNNGTYTLTQTGSALVASGTFSASNITSGTHSPTITNGANVAASTPFDIVWLRVGNTVTVSGKMQVDPTAAASTLTQLEMTIPVASNFSAEAQLSGVLACGDTLESGRIYASAANDRAVFEWVSATTSNHNIGFHYSYQVI